jgi:hypothetical protein
MHPAHDATALIFRPARSPLTSGRAGTSAWRLEFASRSAPWIEPLMGWTGSAEMLSQLSLTFPSLEAAVAYARRQGLRYTIIEPAPHQERVTEVPQSKRTLALAA